MAISTRRKFLITRIAALIKNLENIEEDFTLDKSLERQADRMEALMNHQKEKNSYRQANRDKRTAIEKANAEAAKKAAAEAEAAAKANKPAKEEGSAAQEGE